MEYKNVFFGLIVMFLVTTAFTLFAVNMNEKYSTAGAATIDTGFMQDSGADDIESYAGAMSTSVGNSTTPPSVSPTQELTQSKNTFSLIRSMVDFVPKLLRTSAAILGIPEQYQNMAVWAFVFAFGITLAYILIAGVKEWIF